ncbi:olfactory receptor 1002-like [Bombina bombina]|uniref:olfactory receptor 1002-like n=1 Tax=Bombina bombina TaxID=8345 RepID=UPI00235ABE22|nr:olfactory receptor 1002-like [Bombina bombina]
MEDYSDLAISSETTSAIPDGDGVNTDTFEYTDEDVNRFLVAADLSELRGETPINVYHKLLNLRKRLTDFHLHAVYLSNYHRNRQIPRGFRFARGYDREMVIDIKAEAIKRFEGNTIKPRAINNSEEKINFITTFDPMHQKDAGAISKHWDLVHSDKSLPFVKQQHPRMNMSITLQPMVPQDVKSRENQSTVTKVILLGFPNLQSSRIIIVFAFLIIYIATLVGNILIIALVSTSNNLRSPMYFFLCQLSISDILETTTIMPNCMSVVLKEGTTMSIVECITQFCMFGSCSVTECFILTVMSYDRYVAICKPLHYNNVMNFTFCIHLIICSWLTGFMVTLLITIMLYRLNFCGPNIIDHFFCDFKPIVQLSCSDTTIVEMIVFLVATPETFIQTMFIVGTYIYIFITIVHISSKVERRKTFSTCSSHLTVVCTYYGTLISIYVAPTQGQTFNINKVLSLLYTVVTPLLNPIIYSLRNKEIKTAIITFYKKYMNII